MNIKSFLLQLQKDYELEFEICLSEMKSFLKRNASTDLNWKCKYYIVKSMGIYLQRLNVCNRTERDMELYSIKLKDPGLEEVTTLKATWKTTKFATLFQKQVGFGLKKKADSILALNK